MHSSTTNNKPPKLQQNHFNPKSVLILAKTSQLKLEYERVKERYANSSVQGPFNKQFLNDLERQITAERLEEFKKRHIQQSEFVKSITKAIRDRGINFTVVERKNYTKKLVDESDLIISAGGDGTYLAAAKKINGPEIPLIGINTDPIGSEGYLCLNGKSEEPATEVIKRVLDNQFRWMYRQRIRVTIVRPSPSVSASSSSTSIGIPNFAKEMIIPASSLAMDDLSDNSFDDRFHDNETQTVGQRFRSPSSDEDQDENSDTDPIERKLALNEVFIGESHAARVSYYDVQIDDGSFIKQKSSGITVCTGSGSTSWHYNINRLTEQNLAEIFNVARETGISFSGAIDLHEICRLYNERLVFPPNEQKMAFSVRDPVFNQTFEMSASRGLVHRIRIKSRCIHAHLILDGSTSIPFNRGAEVLLEIHPEDAVRTAVFQ